MAASWKQYLVVDDEGKGHLPVRDTQDGPLNHHLMGAAWAALHEGYRGKKYQGPGKQAAIERLKALYRSEGMELPEAKGADGQMGSGQLGETENGKSKVENGRPVSSFQLSVSDSQPSAHRPACLSACRQDVPRFMVLLAEAPAAGLIRIPIAITGAWKGAEKEFSIELDDLEEIRANFARKPSGEINVDYEHASEVPFGTGGPVLSAGRIVKLDEPEPFADREIGRSGDRVNNSPDPPTSRSSDHPVRYILWGWYKPTERARELIQAREYRYISPAIRWGAKDKVTGRAQGTTLTSVALVNKPFLEEMPAIGGEVQQADGPVGRSANAYSATRPLPTGPPAQTGTCPPACFAETVGEQRVFVSLGQVHVPGPVNQVRGSGRGTRVPSPEISDAFGQPEKGSGTGIQDSGSESRVANPGSLFRRENNMATKSLNLRCLTAADVAKYGLPESHLGKIGVFDDDEHLGTADWPEGWTDAQGGLDDTTSCEVKSSEVIGTAPDMSALDFASEIGMPGKSLSEIAGMVSLGKANGARPGPGSTFGLLSECIHEGRLNLSEAGALADAGKVKFSTIMAAQQAERRVEAAVRAGKVLPRNRAHALRVAFSDAAAFAALVEQGQPVVDLRTRGHAGGGEPLTAQQALMAEVSSYAQEHKCSIGVALSEITKTRPELWQEYSEEIVTAVAAEGYEEE